MKHLKASALALLGAASPLIAMADDYDYSYNTSSTTELSDTGAAALGIGMIIFFGVIFLVCAALLILWIVMIIDCYKRQFEQRNTWLIILALGFFFGFYPIAAIVYYFMVKRKNLGTKPGSKPAAPVVK